VRVIQGAMSIGIGLCFAAALSADETVTPAQAEFFEKRIRPVLANRCWECHGPETQEANLRLDRYAFVLKGGDTGPAVVPGKPEASELIDAIGYEATGYQMPPDGKLAQETIDDLTAWVKMGAPWPGADREAAGTDHPGQTIDFAARKQHWSYQPVRDVTPPQVRRPEWISTPVDAFVLNRLEQAGLEPSRPADKRTLLRRITFDLTGFPPTREELREFLADDSPDAYRKVVDRLLASPAYGERWGRHWLDLVRFAETAGHEFDYEIPHAWRYRDYVIRALNDDLPYDQFVIEHFAGDLLENPRMRPDTGENESILATAFYWFGQGKHSPVDIRAEECDTVDNQIDVIGKAFLASSIACARCHDHKFDPISTADYYSFAGFLRSSRRDEAIIDPPEQRDELAARIRNAISDSAPDLKSAATERLEPSIDRLLEQLQAAVSVSPEQPPAEGWAKYLTEVVSKNQDHPLSLWTQLGHLADRKSFLDRKKQLRDRWTERASAASHPPDSITIFEDFSGNPREDWFVSGPAFQDALVLGSPIAPGPSAENPVEHVWEHGTLNSGLAGGKWRGAIRSPTFDIGHDSIWYRVRRVGGKPNPGRKHKNGQISLIVDGFHLIQNPLYGMLTLNVPNDGEFHWLRQDVTRFPGHKAYIEFEDLDDGILIVDKIAFSNGGPPAERPDDLQRLILDDETVDSVETLADAYRATFEETFALWQQDSPEEWESASSARWLNWLLRSDQIPKTPSPENSKRDVDRRNRVERLLQEIETLDATIPEPTYALAMADGTPENEHILIRGSHRKLGAEVPRGYLEAFQERTEPISATSSGRLELARTIVADDNPLTARVIVNRLWHHHFGKGIVETVDDFGHMGKAPSHPELLDWLARQLIGNDWSLKRMHRLMVLSNTYQMSSDRLDPAAEEADPENVLLHRMNLQRLEGEAIRDAILLISGRLDRTLYGPSVMPHLTPFMEGRGRPGSGPLDGDGRRSLYINVRRNFLTPLFLAFDFPTPFTTMGRRSVSNVPAQGLSLMNNEFVVQQATRWSERVRDEISPSPPEEANDPRSQRVRLIYETALSRLPSDDELEFADRFLTAQSREYGQLDHPQAWADLCHVVFNLKEFIYVR
jgi:hypothetical protein